MHSLPSPERIVELACVEVIVELALVQEVVAVEVAAVALVGVAEGADGVAHSLRGVGSVRHMFCELRDGELAALTTLRGAANGR